MKQHPGTTEKTRHPAFFTIDVEDYYHILGVSGTPPISEWDGIAPRVEIGLNRLFQLLSEHKVQATLFFLGYIARRFPGLVSKAADLGHEIASHGFFHQEVRNLSAEQFLNDARDSRLLLEDICGHPVRGWRSAGFSVSKSTPWFFDQLLEAGYSYDSSLVPNRGQHREYLEGDDKPGFMVTTSGRIYEFPISMADYGKFSLNMFGGGYLRFYPRPILKKEASRLLEQHPLLIYIHPRELDLEHPRIRMNLYRRFKSYVNLSTVPKKLQLLLELTDWQTLGQYYDALPT